MPLFYEDSLGAKLVEKWNDWWSTGSSADDELIEDREALDAAEAELRDCDPLEQSAAHASDWVPVFGPAKISGLLDIPGPASFLLAGRLASVGIPAAWSPFPPELMSQFARFAGSLCFDRPFTLLVSPEDLPAAAEELDSIGAYPSRSSLYELPIHPALDAEAARRRLIAARALVLVLVPGISLGVF
jgi:hypothetical protein